MMRKLCVTSILLLAGTAFAQNIPTQPAPAQTAPPPAVAMAPAPTPAQILDFQKKSNDWANLNRFQAENARLGPPAPGEDRVIFYGDSITEGWPRRGAFFPGKAYLNRGISGQTTPQMLLRFEQDVVHLQPKVVIILAGTNDIAGNTGPSTQQMIQDNFVAMADIARANHIRVIFTSVLPVADYPWKKGMEPVGKIHDLNIWLKSFSAQNNLGYVDYFSAMADAAGGMKEGISIDGVHPNKAGYDIMEPLASAAIAQALTQPPPK
jgi:lysophospholipase L1-like esterase